MASPVPADPGLVAHGAAGALDGLGGTDALADLLDAGTDRPVPVADRLDAVANRFAGTFWIGLAFVVAFVVTGTNALGTVAGSLAFYVGCFLVWLRVRAVRRHARPGHDVVAPRRAVGAVPVIAGASRRLLGGLKHG